MANDPNTIQYVIQEDGFWYIASKEKNPYVPYITVSAKGVANGLSTEYNDGYDFGPDSYNPSVTSGVPLTQTTGIQEAINSLPNGGKIKLSRGVFEITATPKKDISGLYYLISFPYQPASPSVHRSIYEIEGEGAGGVYTGLTSPALSSDSGTVIHGVYASDVSMFYVLAVPDQSYIAAGTPPKIIIKDIQARFSDNSYRVSPYDLRNSQECMLVNCQGTFDTALQDLVVPPTQTTYDSVPTATEPAVEYNRSAGYIMPWPGPSRSILVGQYSRMEGFDTAYILTDLALLVDCEAALCTTAYRTFPMTGATIAHMISIESNYVHDIVKLFALDCAEATDAPYIIGSIDAQFDSFNSNFIPSYTGTTSSDTVFNLVSTENTTNQGPARGNLKLNFIVAGISGIYNAYANFQVFNSTTEGYGIQYSLNGSNPIIPSIPTNPPVSATVYQNLNYHDIRIYLPVYATTSGTAGTIAYGEDASSTPTEMTAKYVNGATSSTSVDIVELVVPAGHYFEFTASARTVRECIQRRSG